MTTARLEDLTAELIADVRKWRQGIDVAQGKLKGFERETKRRASGIQSALGKISFANVAAGVAAAGTTLAVLTRRAVSSVDAVAKSAKAAGLAGEAYQELSHAAELAGLTQQRFDLASQRLAIQIGRAAAGVEKQASLFKRLKVELGSTESVFMQLADRFREIESESERARIAAELFGDEAGARMVELLRQGSAELDKVRESARRLGIVYSNEALKRAEELNDELTRQSQILQHELNKGLLSIAPSLLSAAQGFTTLARAISGAVREMRVWLGIASPAEMAQVAPSMIDEQEHRLSEVRRELARRRALNAMARRPIGVGATLPARSNKLPTADLEAEERAILAELERLRGLRGLLTKEGEDAPPPTGTGGTVGIGGGIGSGKDESEEERKAKAQAEFRAELEQTIADEERLAAARRTGREHVVSAVEREIELERELARLREQGASEEQIREREAQIRERNRAEERADIEKIREEAQAAELERMEEIRALADALGDTIGALVTDSKRGLEELRNRFIKTLAEIALAALAGQGPKTGGDLLRQVAGGVLGAPIPSGGGSGAPTSTSEPSYRTPGFGGPGFARGGRFKVGGTGGTDSKMVRMRVSPGELLEITPRERAGSGRALQVRQSVHVMVEPGMRVQREERRAGGEEQVRIWVRSALQDDLRFPGTMPSALASTVGRRPAPRRGIA